jgi:hypothetical protein
MWIRINMTKDKSKKSKVEEEDVIFGLIIIAK